MTQAKKDSAAAETEFNTADREFKRTKNLLEAGVVSRADYDAASERLDRARAKREERNLTLKHTTERADQQRAIVNDLQTKAQASAMRANYLVTLLGSQANRREKVTQVAPLDCIVADIPVREGQLVMGGPIATTLMTLADMSAIYVEVDVEEAEISRIESGQPVRIAVDAFGQEGIIGIVIGKGSKPIADPGGPSAGTSSTGPKPFKVRVEMREMSHEVRSRLRPGMSATVIITTGGRR